MDQNPQPRVKKNIMGQEIEMVLIGFKPYESGCSSSHKWLYNHSLIFRLQL